MERPPADRRDRRDKGWGWRGGQPRFLASGASSACTAWDASSRSARPAARRALAGSGLLARSRPPWQQEHSERGQRSTRTTRGRPYRPKAVLEIFRLGLETESGVGGERGRERKGWLNREAFSPLLPLPRLQEIKVRARLFPALTNQLGPEKQPPITCQDRAGPPSPLLLPLVPTPPAPMLGPGASPVGLQVFQSGFQIIEQVDFLAALRAVNIQQFTVVRVPHLPRRLPRAGA